MQFTCKDLFKNGDTVYLPVCEGITPQEVEKRILSWAYYHGHEIRCSCGVWVNSATATAERVLRVCLVSTAPAVGEERRAKARGRQQKKKDPAERERIQRERQERQNRREKRLADILARRERGETLEQIATVYGVTRKAIHGFINYKTKGNDK